MRFSGLNTLLELQTLIFIMLSGSCITETNKNAFSGGNPPPMKTGVQLKSGTLYEPHGWKDPPGVTSGMKKTGE